MELESVSGDDEMWKFAMASDIAACAKEIDKLPLESATLWAPLQELRMELIQEIEYIRSRLPDAAS